MGAGNSIANLANVGQAAASYLPKPTLGSQGISASFQDAMRLMGNVGGSLARAAGGSIGGVPTTAMGDFDALINKQLEAQMEMQTTSMVSNIERSKHESKMAAVRNIRVG